MQNRLEEVEMECLDTSQESDKLIQTQGPSWAVGWCELNGGDQWAIRTFPKPFQLGGCHFHSRTSPRKKPHHLMNKNNVTAQTGQHALHKILRLQFKHH